MANLIFNEKTREYIAPSGAVVPSVTTIIRSSEFYYHFGNSENTEARDRGSLLHRVLYDSHTFKGLFETEGDGEIGWYLKKWKEIREVEGIIPVEGEKMIGSEDLGYAGRFDLKATVRGKKAIIDFKTGKSMDNIYTAVQLSAYAHAEGDIEEIYGLCINPNVNKKGYRLKLLPNKFEVFERLKKEYYLQEVV